VFVVRDRPATLRSFQRRSRSTQRAAEERHEHGEHPGLGSFPASFRVRAGPRRQPVGRASRAARGSLHLERVGPVLGAGLPGERSTSSRGADDDAAKCHPDAHGRCRSVQLSRCTTTLYLPCVGSPATRRRRSPLRPGQSARWAVAILRRPPAVARPTWATSSGAR